ncbi:dephospho-CoA kinase [Demequina aurantiaca]|uniref:dephospho-CoA kinase n=1 Tax=Demequina aurantiaca TaxID=676200 RepID=UPI0007857434|nr:dephospho-CoA kinase [Demequina aurantiaca]
MLRIGLTGGIAAGKSVVAERLGELGAHVVDHDVLSRRVVEPGSAALVEIVHAFGDQVVVRGELDREALGKLIFGDNRARERLNGIVHPYIEAMAAAMDKQARAAGEAVVVHDIPLLVETGQGGAFGLVVTVAAPVEVRLKRLMETRSMLHDHAQARIDSQATDEERAAVADFVFDGSGTREQLRAQVDEFWAIHVPQ